MVDPNGKEWTIFQAVWMCMVIVCGTFKPRDHIRAVKLLIMTETSIGILYQRAIVISLKNIKCMINQ